MEGEFVELVEFGEFVEFPEFVEFVGFVELVGFFLRVLYSVSSGSVCIFVLRLLQQLSEFLRSYPRLPQNRMKCLRCQFPSVIRHRHPASSLRMFENIVATTDAMNCETGSHQSLYRFLTA